MATAEEHGATTMATDITATRRGRSMRRSVAGLVILALTLIATGCMIESPTLEPLAADDTAIATPTPIAAPVFEPTAVPEATPTPQPTATPEPTATPVPTPAPDLPLLEAQTPSESILPETLQPGLVSVPVGGTTTFRLARPRPVLQQPGHTLIYLDADRQAEVDIFTPIANDAGDALADFEAVIDELSTNPVFEDLGELEPVTIAGLSARVFEGSLLTGARGFHTDASTIGNDWAGWFPPARMRLWIIDAPSGPIVVTAESLFDPGQYDDAVRMAGGLLSTITFADAPSS